MRLLMTLGVFLSLIHTAHAEAMCFIESANDVKSDVRSVHVYGVESGEVSSIYKTHAKLPEWIGTRAAKGEGPLWHWKTGNKWYQIRGSKAKYLAYRYPKPRVHPQVCHT